MVLRTNEILTLLSAVNARRSEDVSLRTMAALTHRSAFDLHRRFRQVVGETPKAYTSRVRLSRAAAELLSTERLISVVAARNGFGSHEIFTRTFTRHFGLTPRTYRAQALFPAGERTATIHADAVNSLAPCVGLYRMTTDQRTKPVLVDVIVKDLPEIHALVIRRQVGREDIAATLADCLPAVFTRAQQFGLAIAGPPFARYPEVGIGSVVIEAGFTVAAVPSKAPGDGIEVLTFPAGRAVVAIHSGVYETLPQTHQVIEEWIRQHGHTVADPPRETYLTDPGEYPDPSTWQTEIIQPIK